jgi:hypothetical protein
MGTGELNYGFIKRQEGRRKQDMGKVIKVLWLRICLIGTFLFG